MANTAGYFGFTQFFGGSGGAPTFAQSRRWAASNASAIYFGDPVINSISSATGYIARAADDTTTILAGIFVGCKYLSTAMKRVVWSNYWPGSDTAYDVECYVIDDPNAQFLVQANGSGMVWTGTYPGTMTGGPVGQYANFKIGTGNTANGLSGAYLDGVSTTVTNPFIVRDFYYGAPGQNGSDPTTNYNYLVVGFNNEWLRTNGAGPTGIS